MTKKLAEMAKKTGLNDNDVKKLTRLQLLGICLFAIAGIIGCAKNGGKTTVATPPPAEPQQSQAQPAQNTQAADVQESTPPARPDIGPWGNNYPAGTKYHTVSINDFC